MWVVRDIRTHKVVASGFADRFTAEKEAARLIDETWGHYEAYPESLA